MTEILHPGATRLSQLKKIWETGKPAVLHHSAHDKIAMAADMVAVTAGGTDAVYGINTGFGKLASVKVAPKDVATLQRNLILSHCCGVGEPLDAPTTRLMMVLKLLSLGRCASGVALTTISLIEAMLRTAVGFSERFYPAFQLVGWSNQTPGEALQVAIDEAYGTA